MKAVRRNGHSTKSAISSIERRIKDFARQDIKTHVEAYRQLIKKCGPQRVILFPVSEEHLKMIRLAAHQHSDGDINRYAQALVVETGERDLGELLTRIEKGEVKL